MEKILVTGGTGYIGSSLCKTLLDVGYKVNLYDVRLPESEDLALIIRHPNCNSYFGDILDISLLEKAVEGCHVIIHLAAISDGIRGLINPSLTMQTNLTATSNLLNLAKTTGVKRFLFSSTFGVYGNKYKGVLVENLKVNPEEPYSISKAKCEELLAQANDDSFATASLRLATVYGVSIQNKFDFLVNNLTSIAITTKKLCIFGGHQRRPQVHVQDVVEAFLTMIKEPIEKISGKIFNISSSSPSLNEIAVILKEYIPGLKVEYLPERENELSYILDGGKIVDNFNYAYKYDLRYGITELIQHFETTRLLQ